MEGIAQQKRIRIDIDGRTAVISGKDDLYQGDSYANEIVVEVLRGGAAANLSGYTASGEMQRSDEAKVPCEGSVTGNVITVTLNEHCYKEAGAYMLSVMLSKDAGQTTRTILRIFGEVQRAASGPTVDISETMVDVDAVLALYEEMKTAKNEAEEAAEIAKKVPVIGEGGFWQFWDAVQKNYVGSGYRSIPALTFRAETGAPGTNVQMVITGTVEEPVITLTIPRGDTGAVEGIDYFSGSPSALGTASPGTANGVARGDHVHPLPGAGALQVISYAMAQTLTAAQQLQALANIGAVSYEAQALTDEQKAQARQNIGADSTYTLPAATADTLGGVKLGGGFTAPDGVLTLPTATADTLGGVKLGGGFTAQDGVLTLPTATADTLGGVKLGGAFTAPDGVLTFDGEPAEIVTFIERATYSKDAKIGTVVPLDAEAIYLATFRGQGVGIMTASKTSDGVSYMMRGGGFVIESISGKNLAVDITALSFAGNGATSGTLSYLNRYYLNGTAISQTTPTSLDIGPVYMLRKIAQ